MNRLLSPAQTATDMRKSALAQFRQLCCLGLGGPAVMPGLLAASHQLISSESNAFFWSDARGGLAGFLPEYAIPEVVDSVLGEFEGLIDRTLPISFGQTMRRGRPVGNLLPLFDRKFYLGPVYNLIYRPYDLHHAIDVVVREREGGMGLGALVVGRSRRQPEFSVTERVELQCLVPYLAHALHPRNGPAMTDFIDSGDCGLVILSRSAKLVHASARAREILQLAAARGGARDASQSSALRSNTLQSVYERLVRIFQEGDADPPVVEQRTPAGRFVYRAHWLDPEKTGDGALVGVIVQHQEPASLVMLRRMHAVGLSAKQKEVGLLLAQDQSFEAIAAALHISVATAKDYAQRIYRKANVHSKDELMRALR